MENETEVLEPDTQNEGSHLAENPPEQQDSGNSPAPATPPAPTIDALALYRESLAERQRLQQELETLRRQQAAPATPDPVSDQDIERLGQTEYPRRVMRQELSATVSPEIHEMARTVKRDKELQSAEQQFFAANPHLAAYKDQLAAPVRQFYQNATSVDPTDYAMRAYAAVGYLATQAQLQTPSALVETPRSTPAGRQGAPPAPTSSTRRLTELERSAMRKYGYDPAKADDVKKFFAIVEDDNGVEL